LTPEWFRKAGRCLAEMMGEGRTVVVGGDVRGSTALLKAALIEGLVAGGRVVADVGIVPGPVGHFGVRMLRSDALAYVTGQQGPPESNGLAFSLAGSPGIGDDMERFRGLMEGQGLADAAAGEVENWAEDILDEYLAWLRAAVLPVRNGRPMRVMVDAGNGCMGALIPRAFEGREGVSVELIRGDVDPGFTGRGPDCSAPGALDGLAAQVKEAGAALGVSFDATGSRVRFVDDKAAAVSADTAGVVLLRHLRAAVSGRPVIVDARCSSMVAEEVKKVGGRLVLERGEAALLAGRTAREGAAFGLSVDGVYTFSEIGGAVDGLFTAVRVVEMLRSGSDPLSKLCDGLKASPTIRGVRVACSAEGVRAVLNRIRAGCPGGTQTDVGGLHVRMEGGWAAVLPYPGDEEIEFSFEGKDEATLERIATDVLNMAPEVREKARRLAGLPDLPAPDPYAYLDDEKP